MIFKEADLRSGLAFKRSEFLKTTSKQGSVESCVPTILTNIDEIGYKQNQVNVKSVRFEQPADQFLVLREKFNKSHSDLRARFASNFDEQSSVNETSE